MKLQIAYVKAKGDLRNERVVLKITSRTDIGKYILADTTYNPDSSISNKLRHTFWFPDKIVEEGDYVALYTKDGENSEFENKGGSTTHTFYWGLDKTIWNVDGDGVVICEVSNWIAKNLGK